MSTLFEELTAVTTDFEALDIRLDEDKPDRVVAAMNRPMSSCDRSDHGQRISPCASGWNITRTS